MLNDTTKRLRILIIAPWLPYPANWGGAIRVYQFVHNLSRHHEVTLLTFGTPADTERIDALRKVCHSVQVMPAPDSHGGKKRVDQLLSLFSRRSFSAQSVTSREMQGKITEMVETQAFDLVQVEFAHLSGYNFGVSVPVVLDEHNIEYELLYRMHLTERTLFRRFYNWLEYKKYQGEEHALWARVDACVFTSGRETDMMQKQASNVFAATVPNGVDTEYFQTSGEEGDPDNIVFTGLISYRPNNDAVLYFAREILPLILERRPQTVFTIVGRGPTDEVRRLEGPNIHVTGEVPDVRPYIHKAGVMVVPLRMGSGTRLKVLEGLAMSKPVVSTTLGFEGIEARGEEHLRIADTPQEFADAVIFLQENRDTGLAMGQRGRTLVESRYSWVSITENLEGIHRQVLENRRLASLKSDR